MDTGIVPTRHKLTVYDYHPMGEAGILSEDDRVELIDGELIDMAPIGSGHDAVVNRIAEALFAACAGRAIVSVRNSVRLDELNEPQPDFAILRHRMDFYNGALPTAGDIHLLIEVAGSSLRFDCGVKLPLYARAGIAEVWIIDMQGRAVDIHRTPEGGRYRDVATHGRGDTVRLPAGLDTEIPLDRLLGPG